MIYDLCQLVQDFLTSRNKKPAISEHEKMLQKNAKLMIEQEVWFSRRNLLRDSKKNFGIIFSVSEQLPNLVKLPKLRRRMNGVEWRNWIAATKQVLSVNCACVKWIWTNWEIVRQWSFYHQILEVKQMSTKGFTNCLTAKPSGRRSIIWLPNGWLNMK